MTVAELKKLLADYPDDAVVLYSDGEYGDIEVNASRQMEIYRWQSPDPKAVSFWNTCPVSQDIKRWTQEGTGIGIVLY